MNRRHRDADDRAEHAAAHADFVERSTVNDINDKLAELRLILADWMGRESACDARYAVRHLQVLLADLNGQPPHDPQEHWRCHPITDEVEEAIDEAEMRIEGHRRSFSGFGARTSPVNAAISHSQSQARRLK